MNNSTEITGLVTRGRASRLLGVSESTIDRMRKRGVLSDRGTVGKIVLIEPESVRQVRDFLRRREIYAQGGQATESTNQTTLERSFR